MSDLIEELVGGSAESRGKNLRIKRAQNDFGYFCRHYLSDYFFTDAAEYQKILYDVADTQVLTEETAEKIKRFVHEKYHLLLRPSKQLAGAMFIEPREHGKTVRWSFAYVLWCVLTGKKRYALLIGASAESAKENLINIKRELEENEELLADFGDLKGAIWRDDRIELTNGTCLQAKGSGASMRGTRFRQYRPDLIVLDDVLKDDAVDSPSQRDKIYRWLKKVVVLEFDVERRASFDQVMTAIDHGVEISKDALYTLYGIPKPRDADDVFAGNSAQNTLTLSDSDYGKKKVRGGKQEERKTVRII